MIEEKYAEEIVGKRVVLTTISNVSYAGTLIDIYTNKKCVTGCFVETDSLVGVSILSDGTLWEGQTAL